MTIARTTLNDVLTTVTDPFYSDNWELYFPSLSSKITGGISSKALQIQCKNISLPGIQNEAQDIMLHGFKTSAGGRTVFLNTINVTFLENRQLQVYKLLKNWVNAVRDFRTQISIGKDNYATVGWLLTYDETGTLNNKLYLVNTFCSEVQDVSLDGSSANAVDVSATFRFDFADELLSSVAGTSSQHTLGVNS